MQQKNKLGIGFLISSFINIVLALIVAFGISIFSQTIPIILALLTMINAAYLLYKAFYIFREERI
ncbi:LysE family transporter [Staphylococcus xylosus]|uniref:LysE family transporter n=1 Tax=Staphylococcus xylosus TaxID=1288 RepID=UPI003F54612F